MTTKTHFSKRILSLMLSVLMVATMLPTFVFSNPDTAEASDVPSTDYWQVMGSTDFTKATWTYQNKSWWNMASGDHDFVWQCADAPTVNTGDKTLSWNTKVWKNGSGDSTPVTPNTDTTSTYGLASYKAEKQQKYLYLTGYNGTTYKGTLSEDGKNKDRIFKDVDSFKIDLEFTYLGATTLGGDDFYNRPGVGTKSAFIKLAADEDKYNFDHYERDPWDNEYFAQEVWGQRNINGTDNIASKGNILNGTSPNYEVELSTRNTYINVNETYHYVLYEANGWLNSYVANQNGDVIINYDPIDVSSYGKTPSDITGIYIGTSNGKYIGNIAYKTVTIYKGVDTSTTDASRSKYLYTYFTGNSTTGESLHYALSDDGVNFAPVNDGLPVWDSTKSWSITSYPDNAGAAATKHIRDPYVLQKRNANGTLDDGYYILATDLDTQNGTNFGNRNTKLLVYDVDNLAQIDNVTPWAVDTQSIVGSLCDSSGTVSRAWAPQAIWDPAVGKYMLYWSVGFINGETRVFYIYTSDFKTDLDDAVPKPLVDYNFYKSGDTEYNSNIDADITYYNGLYWLYIKDENEDSTGDPNRKTVYRAFAPSANGPYTNFTQISSTTMEGPQLYELTNGKYAFMADIYSSGEYNIYKGDYPYSINMSSAETSNISYLHPRHGSVMRITPAEYRAILNEFGTLTPGSIEYLWANDNGTENAGSRWWGNKDAGGHVYDIGKYSTFTDVGGYLTLSPGNVFITESSVLDLVNGGQYTINFKFKATDKATLEDAYTAFSISNGSKDFLRLSESGKLYVNGTAATPSANFVSGTEYDVTITYNGYTVFMLVNGNYVCGANATNASATYVGFGWTNAAGPGSYESNTFTTATYRYGKMTMTPVATETGHEADFLGQICTSADIATNKIKSFTAEGLHEGRTATNAYNNVIYCSNTTYWNTDSYSGTGKSGKTTGTSDNWSSWYGKARHLSYKMPMPTNIVLAYDGVAAHKPATPVELEFWSYNTDYKSVIRCLHYYGEDGPSSQNDKFELADYWYGFYQANDARESDSLDWWQRWPGDVYGEDNIRDSDKDWAGKIGYKPQTDSDTIHDGSNHMFWWNKLNYEGSGDTTNYFEKYSNTTFLTYSSTGDDGDWGRNKQRPYTGGFTAEYLVNSGNNIYIVNYEPVYNILKETSPTTVTLDGVPYNIRELRNYLLTGDGRWKYTTASKAAALEALRAVGDIDPNQVSESHPNGYDFSGGETCEADSTTGVEGAVHNCAADIKTAVDGFTNIPTTLVKNVFRVQYIDINGTTQADYNVTAGGSVTSGDIPANTATEHVVDSKPFQHYVYAWSPATEADGEFDEDTLTLTPHRNLTITETATAENCGTTTVAAAGDVNGYKYCDCSVCNTHDSADRIWDDRTEDWSAYDTAAASVATKYADTTYTDSSRAAYKTACDTVTNAVTADDETKSHSYITTQKAALDTAERLLNQKADFTAVDNAISEKSDARSTNNYDGSNNQINTYDSWTSFVSKYTDASVCAHYDRNDTPKYKVDGSGYVTSALSDDQNSINTTGAALAAATLIAVGDADKYTTFDNARDVVSAMDRDKYTATGLAYIDGVKDAQEHGTGGVYHKLSAAEATAYNSTTGQSLAENALVKNSTNPDANTATLLSAVTTLDADAGGTYIKRFWVTLTVEDDGVASSPTSATVKYGDAHTFAPSVASGKSITSWSITNYDYSVAIGDVDSNNPIGSSKATGYGNNSLTKTVTNNLAVTAIVDSDAAASNKSKIVINDCYNKVQDVFFIDGTDEPTIADLTSSTITIGGTEVTAKAIPFYTFSTWRKTIDATNHVYKYTPVYTAAESFNFSFYGAQVTTLNSVQFDKRVTVQFDTSKLAEGETFKAWAVKTSANKYQIASYNQNFYFYACQNENYVPIIKKDGVYKAKTADGTYDELTASKIDGDIPTVANVTADSVLTQKLDGNLPFIAIENVKVNDEKYQIRTFVRVTQGANNVTGYGILLKNGSTLEQANALTTTNNDKKTAITNILETGQFTYTLTNKKNGAYKPFSKNVGIRGYINYDFSYTAANTTTSISAVDYSNGALATIV